MDDKTKSRTKAVGVTAGVVLALYGVGRGMGSIDVSRQKSYQNSLDTNSRVTELKNGGYKLRTDSFDYLNYKDKTETSVIVGDNNQNTAIFRCAELGMAAKVENIPLKDNDMMNSVVAVKCVAPDVVKK